MNKVVQRLLVFFVGLPLVICLVYFNQFHHIALHALIFIASLLASNELYQLLKHKFSLQFRPLVIISSVMPVFVAALLVYFELNISIVNYVFVFLILLCMAWEVLFEKSFENSVSHLITSMFIIFYSGFIILFFQLF